MATTATGKRSREQTTITDLDARLRAYDRGPFIELLGMYMECFPTRESIEQFADKYPDRYLMAMAHLGRMAGYTDKTETDFNVNVTVSVIRKMSDSQIEDRLKVLTLKAQEADSKVIDVDDEGDAINKLPHLEPDAELE